jgi:MoaA/NifB/PqqE/SkfB family radical SAM enzyme
MGLDVIERDLTLLKKILRCQTVNIVGGEPTLHKQLVDVMKLLTGIRIDINHCLVTNGRLLPTFEDDFWSSLESMSISVYPNLNMEVVALAERKSKEHGFGFGTRIFTEFYAQFEDRPDGSSFHNCHWKTDCFTVHDGYFYLCPQSAFFPKTVMGLPENIDGLPLDGATEQSLLDYMNRKEPFNACRKCSGGFSLRRPWSQSKTRDEWIKESSV